MAIIYDSITNSPSYAGDHQAAFVSGKVKSRVIWGIFAVFAALTFLPLLLAPIVIGVFIFILAKMPSSIKQSKARHRILQTFCSQNNFAYLTSTPEGNHFGIFKGITRFDSCIEGNLGDFPFSYSLIQTDRGTKNGVSFAALEVRLPISLPRLFINLKKNNIAGYEISLHQGLTKQTRYFEGDFYKYYDVEAEEGKETEILEIISPEVMAALIDKNLFDIYLEGNRLTIYQPHATEIEYFAFVPILLPTAEMLLQEINRIRLKVGVQSL
jgi:hypothetical protein